MRVVLRHILIAALIVFSHHAMASDMSIYNRDLYDRITFESIPCDKVNLTISNKTPSLFSG